MTQQRPVLGLGPHGEFAASVEQLQLEPKKIELARAAAYRVALVLHTTASDWSKLQIEGISTTLARFGASLIEIIDCAFSAERQIEALGRLRSERPDAVLSIPVDTVATADAHRNLAAAGITLVLMDNVPAGLLARRHYASVVSADNFGNGQLAAELLSGAVPRGGSVGVVGFGVDFFVTNERELGFRKWLKEHRPDVKTRHIVFPEPDSAGDAVTRFLAEQAVDAFFVVWDDPAMDVVDALRRLGRSVPITTVDLGERVARELASGGLIHGVAAQLPFDQGVAEATTAIMALVGEEPPPWIALPGVAVTRSNILEAYSAVWHRPAPPNLAAAVGAPATR